MNDTTSIPFTLRAAAGLPETPPALAQATLVIIDAQQEYSDAGLLPLDGLAPAVENITQLLTKSRQLGIPIVHVAHQGGAGAPFAPEAGGRFLAAVEPMANETIVRKTLPNSFAHTELHQTLKDLEVSQLILIGFMTHMCVSSTARAALDLGYSTTIAADATATRSLPGTNGSRTVTAAEVHNSALAELADRFSVVTTTDKLV